MLPVIALVGRPNVGKSTLFNRLTKTRDALVASIPGLTRDRQYGRGVLGEFDYVVVDTGGLSGEDDGIDGPMAAQSKQAIEEADLILFLVDAKSGRMPGDHDIAALLRSQNKPVVLVANKVDGQNPDYILGEFAELGFGASARISASNGHGIAQLLADRIAPQLPDQPLDESGKAEARGIKMAVVGRPNVGKSTLVNRMLGEDRVVVFDQAGTTRDSI
ncbi:MAG: ribosome biogenesis GTPase Der, partial [Pseudomonadales bacterium]